MEASVSPATTSRSHPVVKRLTHEWDLLKQQMHIVIVCMVVLLYGSLILFRNLAFYRFPLEPNRLHDLGHELLPQYDGLQSLPTRLLGVMDGYVMVLLLCTLFGNQTNYQKPYMVNMLVRLGVVISVGHVLRFFTYITTSLPGSADYCLSNNHTDIPFPARPQSILECFTKVSLDLDYSCGDLMFSGHMLQAVSIGMFNQTYVQDILRLRWLTYAVLVVFVWCLVIVQALAIISLRHHYTADVVAASYVTPMLWYTYEHKFRLREKEPRNILEPTTLTPHEFEEVNYVYRELGDEDQEA